MVVSQKAKIGLIAVIIVISTVLVLNIRTKTNHIQIIYFRESSCIVVEKTDDAMEEIRNDLGNSVTIKTISLDNKESLTQEENELIIKYQVIGTPEIIINGKEYTKEFTKEELEKEICKKFLIKPDGCK